METNRGGRVGRMMRAAGFALLAVGLAVPSSGSPGRQDGSPPVPPLFGGIQVNEPDHRRWVRAMSAAGLDTVQVTLYARQQEWDGSGLHWVDEAPAVVAEIRAAEAAGLRTVLVMRVALEHGLAANRHLWHGMIWPRDEELDAWARSYRQFVLHGARMAAAEGVDLFVVGNELSALTSTTPLAELPELYRYWIDPVRVGEVRQTLVGCADSVLATGAGEDLVHLDGGRHPDLEAMLREQERVRRQWVRTVTGADPGSLAELNRRRRRHEAFWRSLIADVRRVYSGPVTYGANFDQYAEVGFWDALDALGVTGYFPLSRYGLEPSERRRHLADSWRDVGAALERVAGGKPVVLLELGWTRKAGATVRPYSYDRVEVLETAGPDPGLTCVHWASQRLDPRERVAAMAALGDVVEAGQFDSLRGFLLWKLTTVPEHRAIEPFAVVLSTGRHPGQADTAFLAQAARVADLTRTGLADSGSPDVHDTLRQE